MIFIFLFFGATITWYEAGCDTIRYPYPIPSILSTTTASQSVTRSASQSASRSIRRGRWWWWWWYPLFFARWLTLSLRSDLFWVCIKCNGETEYFVTNRQPTKQPEQYQQKQQDNINTGRQDWVAVTNIENEGMRAAYMYMKGWWVLIEENGKWEKYLAHNSQQYKYVRLYR